jgi:predicted amidophosphoribosyltransferase
MAVIVGLLELVVVLTPVAILAALLLAFRWIGRRESRRENGLCVECGYDLTGNRSGICPECGWRVGRIW